MKGLFVDANRNAAVVIGDRDIKNDVQDKKRREKYRKMFRISFLPRKYFRKLGEADSEEEIGFEIYLNHAQYELRSQYQSYLSSTDQ